jgi:hypothetical protein
MRCGMLHNGFSENDSYASYQFKCCRLSIRFTKVIKQLDPSETYIFTRV